MYNTEEQFILNKVVRRHANLLFVLFADVNTGGDVSSWANSSLSTMTSSVDWFVAPAQGSNLTVSELLWIILFYFICLKYRQSLEMFSPQTRYMLRLFSDLPEIWLHNMLKNGGLTYAYIHSTYIKITSACTHMNTLCMYSKNTFYMQLLAEISYLLENIT